MGALLTRKRQIAAKIEDVEGTAETLTASDAGLLVIDPVFSVEDDATERNPARATLSNLADIPWGAHVSMRFRLEIRGKGDTSDISTPPAESALLQACGLRQRRRFSRIYSSVQPIVTSTTVDADSASGQKVLNVTATTGFSAGNGIIIGENTANEELAVIASVQAGTSLTLVDNLANSHAALDADVVTLSVGHEVEVPEVYTTVDTTSAAGQKVLSVASTTGFTAGDYVLIGHNTAREEIRRIDSIQAGTSLTMEENLDFEHTDAQADDVIELTSPVEGVQFLPYSRRRERTTVDADSASGQPVLNVTATDDFEVGDWIVIGEGTASREEGKVRSIQAGISLTLWQDLWYAHAAVDAHTVHTGVPSLTMSMYQDGIVHTMFGARGTVRQTVEVGRPGYYDFEFRGVYNGGTSDASMLTGIDYGDSLPTGWKSANLTVDSVALICNSANTDIANTLEYRSDANAAQGLRSVLITSRRPTLVMDPEMEKVADFDSYGKRQSGTESAITYRIGTALANRIVVTVPAAQIRSLEDSNRNSLATAGTTFILNGDDTVAGSEEFDIYYT